MFKAGDRLFFRTVTFHMLGEILEVSDGWAKLKDASWVADSGRFGVAIEHGKLEEAEYLGEAFVNLATVTDAEPWKHDLPKASV